VQLTLLGRRKYVHSVQQLAREERARDAFHPDGLPKFRLFGFDASDMLAHMNLGPEDAIGGEEEEGDEDDADDLDPETERKFLTLSWWLLHVGWKDIGERVRRGVEDVFERCAVSPGKGVFFS
jgi:peroxin-3